MSESSRQIKTGAIISYISLIVSTVLSLIYMPWMVDKIGKSQYALYTLVNSFISIFMLDFGLGASVSRFVAKYRAENDEKKINEFVSMIEQMYIIIGIAITIVLLIAYMCLESIYKGLTPEEIGIYKQLFIIVGIYSIISFPCMPFGGILNAYEQFMQMKFCDLFNKLFSILFAIAALLMGGGVKSVVIANVITGIIANLIRIIIIKRSTKIKIKFEKIDITSFKEVMGFSVWILVSNIAQRCIFTLAPTVLGIVSNSDQIAIFSPASTLEGYFYYFAAAVNGLFLATISRYIANNEDDKIFGLMIKVGRYQFVVLGFIFIGFVCVGYDFLYAWMGEFYTKSWICALCLFIPDIFLYTQQIANTTAIAKNKVKEQSLGYVGMALICVPISFILSQKIGALGASIAIAISYTFLFIYMSVLYHKKLNFNMFDFFKQCYAKLIIPIILSGVVGFYICKYINVDNTWFKIAYKTIIITVIYWLFIWPALKKDEKAFAKRLIIRKK